MVRIQCRHDPAPPWNSATTGAVPPDWSHRCQTILPSPHGRFVAGGLVLDAVQDGLRVLGHLVVHPGRVLGVWVCVQFRDRGGLTPNRGAGGLGCEGVAS